MASTLAISTPKVYSYIRFSTPEQKMGDSERRQTEGARAWAKRKGMPFDESLVDAGVSGYSGKHRKRGALGAFLARVEAGEIAPGSILVVENIDRLSREGVADTLREIIFKLWDFGITLQTLQPEETYEPGCSNSPRFLALFIYMQRARDESEQKSLRIRAARVAARTRARESGKLLTSQVPWWLTVESGQPKLVEAAADAIRLIFEKKLAGVGSHRIAAELNAQALWSPPPRRKADREAGKQGNGWRASYVKKILGNRAVLGEYQPFQRQGDKRVPVDEPIADFFPRVIHEEVYYAVQKQLDENRGKGGRTGKAGNLLVHLVKCAYCGGPMAFVDKGKSSKGGRYLVCDQGRRGVDCARRSIRYDEVEVLVLSNCPRLRPEQVLPPQDEQTRKSRALRQRLGAATAETEDISMQMSNLVDQIARTTSVEMRDRYEARVTTLEARQSSLKSQIRQDEMEVTKLEAATETMKAWTAGLEELRNALTSDDTEIRLRMRLHLAQLIERIDVYSEGFSCLSDCDAPDDPHDGEAFAEELEAALHDAAPEQFRDREWLCTFRAFLKFVTQRRMSKHGRFVRVLFKSGASVDLVPPGSLASGVEIKHDGRRRCGWRFIRPDVDRLWRDFQTVRRSK